MDNRSFALLIAVAIVGGAPLVCAAEGPEAVFSIATGPENPRNTEGGFVTLRDGRLLYVYSRFLGKTTADHATGHMASAIRDPETGKWTSHDEPLFPREGLQNDMSASLLRLADGRIALFYAVKNSIQDCRMRMRTSDDEGETWSDPVDCMPGESNYFVVNNDRVIQTKSGRLIIPAAGHVRDGKWSAAADLVCFLSDDAGKTWRRGKQSLVGLKEGGQRYTTQEPGVIELNDGRILLWCRTNIGTQSVAYSEDGGETFSKLEPWNFRSPRAPASIKRIPTTGDLLLVWNDDFDPSAGHSGKRTPLNTAISQDEGKTWSHVRSLETDPAGWFCYTAIHFDEDEVLFAYWLTHPKGLSHGIGTRVTQVPIAWLYEEQE
ncbi:MAG: sialidase family protein [Pirellulaceae bacterium]